MTKHRIEGGDRIPARFLNKGAKMAVPNKYREPPKPEDARPLFKAEGEVAKGKVRVEIIGGPNGRVYASDDLRLFKGDLVDLSEADAELLCGLNFAKIPWKAQAPAAPETKTTLSLPDHKK